MKLAYKLIVMLLIVLILPFAALAADNQWSGSGPFATGLANRSITALAVSPDGINVYAGSGSGTVHRYTFAPPTATTGAATTVTTSSATLNGTVNANNADTTISFEYGLTDSYGSSATAIPASASGPSNTSVSASLSGLAAGTSYHYRVIAVNSAGTTVGNDQTFTTTSIAVAGICGPATEHSFTSAPQEELCNSGTPSVIPSGNGPWNWICLGLNNGANSNTCTAAQSYIITATAVNNGMVSCIPGIVTSGGSATCTIQADDGYTLTGLTDNGVNVLGNVSAGTYIINTVTTGHTISATFTDTTGPELMLSAMGDSNKTTSEVLNITGNAFDVSGVASLTINGVDLTASAGLFSHALRLVKAPATNTITITATDGLGNQTTDIRTITYDPTLPAISLITAPADGSRLHNSASVIIGGTVADDTITVSVTLNGAPISTTTGPSFYQELTLNNRINTITITATDTLDGTRTNTIKRTVFYNPTSPTLVITSPAEDIFTQNSSITVNGTIAHAAEATSLAYSLDNGATWNPLAATSDGTVPGSFSFTDAFANTPGTYPIKVQAQRTSDGVNLGTVNRTIIYADNTVDAFTFTPKTGIQPSTTVESEPVTITGINVPAAITISDGAEYAVATWNGSSWGTFSAWSATIPATLNNNDKIKVRLTSSASYNTTVIATLTIGGVPGTFSVSTKQQTGMISPNGGEVLSGLATHNVTWAAFPDATKYTLYYSTNSGTTWVWLANIGTVTSYTWNVPNISTTTAKFRVAAYNGATSIGQAYSAANFTIQPSMTVTSPNGGENITGLSTRTVTWDAYPGATSYNLHYTTDSGSTWTPVTTVGAVTSYIWTVPNVNSTTAKIRVSAYNGATLLAEDTSNSTFSIIPSMTVTSPNGGETVKGLTNHTITWNSFPGATKFTVYYSTNGGTSWVWVANTGAITSYNWNVPNISTTTAKIRIAAYNGAAYLGQDISDANFSITANMAVTSPNGNETVTALTTHNVTWIAFPGSTKYTLYYSTNGGTSWVWVANTGAVTSYSWNVPNVTTTTAKFRVAAYNGTTYLGQDISDNNFTIAPGGPAPGAIITPNGGETLNGLTPQTVTWNEKPGATKYTLYYSTNGGTSWVWVTNTGAVTSYSWNVPNVTTTTAKFRVAAYNGTTYLGQDISDNNFTITAQPL